MKSSMTMEAMAREVFRQKGSKLDFVCDTRKIQLSAFDGNIRVHGLNDASFGLTKEAINQLTDYYKVGRPYMQKMLGSSVPLAAMNLNHWLGQTGPDGKADLRMFRCLDGNVRAFLSNGYKRVDNIDLLTGLMPVFQEFSGLRFEVAHLDPTKMQIKVFWEGNRQSVEVGDVIEAGIMISNSETGHASLNVQPMTFRLACKNGAIHREYGTRKYHAGTRIGEAETVMQLYSDETMKQDHKAYIMKVADIVKASLRGVWLENVVADMRKARGIVVEEAVKEVKILANDNAFSQAEEDMVLNFFLQGGDNTAYGLFNAITYTSQQLEDYDRATEFEEIGGKYLSLVASK